MTLPIIAHLPLLAGLLAVAAGCLFIGVVVAQDGGAPPPDLAPMGLLPSQATRIVEPTKRARWEEQYAEMQTVRAGPEPTRDFAYTPPAATPVPYRTGIISGGNPIGDFIPGNLWNGYLNGEKITIRAGHDRATRAGVIHVRRPGGESNHDWLSTPPGSGALEIVSVEGNVVQLLEEGGRTLTFDMSSLIIFADSTPIAGGTITPVATATVVETPLPQNSPIAP